MKTGQLKMMHSSKARQMQMRRRMKKLQMCLLMNMQWNSRWKRTLRFPEMKALTKQVPDMKLLPLKRMQRKLLNRPRLPVKSLQSRTLKESIRIILLAKRMRKMHLKRM